MGRLTDTFQTLLHGSKAERRVTSELRLIRVAKLEWEETFLDILDKLNKQLGKYAKREVRELEKNVSGAEAPTSIEAAPGNHKAELRKRAAALTGVPIRTRRIPAPVAPNGENP